MKKILLIEDNKDVRENTLEILQLSGYDAVAAENGKSGVELAMQYNPDLILCDIMMPGLDGYGVLHILNQRPETASIPFIFLTAKSEKSDVRIGMNQGADDYITKPFEETDLLKTIQARLKRSENTKKYFDEIQSSNLTGNSLSEKDLFSIIKHYKKKELVYHEGDSSSFIYKIKKGVVRLFNYNSEGKEYTIELLKEGSFFGYTGLFTNEIRNESAEIIDDADIAVIPSLKFKDFLLSDNELLLQFLKLLSGNISQKETELLHLAYDTVRKRVADSLIKLSEKCPEILTKQGLSVPRELLSSMAGTSTESAIRVLSGFKTDQIIEINGSNIWIAKMDELKKIKF